MKRNSFIHFISQGHAVQLAIGIIIAGAIQEVISSLVSNILFPFLGWITGGITVSSLSFKLGENIVQYGSFLESVINFFVIGFGVYIFIKVYDRLQTTDILNNLDLVSREPKEIKEISEVLNEINSNLKAINENQKKLLEKEK